ncbi:hypothetical protein vBAcePPAc_0095 [Aeromonas phage vB_AceP_PAc]|nr:hypothetical protein vBAcePPAc_0095 [Aeromonas phage vB_AceP_PAc]
MSKYELLLKAEEISQIAHKGQKYGEHDYWLRHVCAVERKTKELFNTDYVLRIIAQLHDLMEDSDEFDSEYLYKVFGVEITDAVIAITKEQCESRNQYIERVKQNELALKVKICDTICNLEESIKIQDAKRIIRYSEQLSKLYK